MKKIAILALTSTGIQLARRISALWPQSLAIYVPTKKAQGELLPFPAGSFKAGIQVLFKEQEALICIMATGIVVRSIAAVLSDKREDPAVVVLDEKGQNVISLLSGHLGGSNELTLALAELLESNPVITTATDVQGVAALDVIAQKLNGWYLDFKENTKKFNGYLAEKQPVALLERDLRVSDRRGFTEVGETADLTAFKAVLLVSSYEESLAGDNVLQLVPRQFILGIGAKRDSTFETIQRGYFQFCHLHKLHPFAIKKIVSIDLKKNETGILELAKWLQVPFETYTQTQLSQVAHKYPQSEFVKKVTGVGSVALAAVDVACGGQVLSERYAQQGVTFAFGKE